MNTAINNCNNHSNKKHNHCYLRIIIIIIMFILTIKLDSKSIQAHLNLNLFKIYTIKHLPLGKYKHLERIKLLKTIQLLININQMISINSHITQINRSIKLLLSPGRLKTKRICSTLYHLTKIASIARMTKTKCLKTKGRSKANQSCNPKRCCKLRKFKTNLKLLLNRSSKRTKTLQRAKYQRKRIY